MDSLAVLRERLDGSTQLRLVISRDLYIRVCNEAPPTRMPARRRSGLLTADADRVSPALVIPTSLLRSLAIAPRTD